MRWNRWARYGFAILAPALVGVMLAAGEWAQEPVFSHAGEKPSAPPATRRQGSPTPEHVRDVQQALTNAGYDPGPIDGIFGPRTKAALRKYIAVPPPQVPGPGDQLIARFKAGELREGP
jgi:peptidoglycan hydrolase-like protein with peptidoglycan-binding domain